MKINPEKLKEIASKSTEAVIKLRIAIEEFQNLFWEQPLELVDDPATKRDIETRPHFSCRVFVNFTRSNTLSCSISAIMVSMDIVCSS